MTMILDDAFMNCSEKLMCGFEALALGFGVFSRVWRLMSRIVIFAIL